MDPVTILILLILGVGAATMLTGCSAQEETEPLKIPEAMPIPKEEIEEELQGKGSGSNTPINADAEIKCTCSEGNITKLKGVTGNDTQGGTAPCENDIEFEPFSCCDALEDKICIPEIEGRKWKNADSRDSTNKVSGLSKESFMFCTYGMGIVYVYTDGQKAGEKYLDNIYRNIVIFCCHSLYGCVD